MAVGVGTLRAELAPATLPVPAQDLSAEGLGFRVYRVYRVYRVWGLSAEGLGASSLGLGFRD